MTPCAIVTFAGARISLRVPGGSSPVVATESSPNFTARGVGLRSGCTPLIWLRP
jgi:hypothetical protein